MVTRIVRTALLLAAIAGAAASHAAVAVGDIPPDALGKDFQDQPVTVSASKGKVVVVSFWASWCGPCRKEMDILENLQVAAGPDALRVVAVNFKEDNKVWSGIRRQLGGLHMTITRDKSWDVVKAYGIDAIPHMFLIDKQGRVAAMHLGYDPKRLDTVVDEINALLAQAEGEP